MTSPPKRSLQTRGSNNPTRNSLHPPRGARSAVAWRALSSAPTRPPVGPASRGAACRVRFPIGSGQAAGRARRPRSRVAIPLTTTAAGVVAPRRSPRPPAPPAHPRWSPSARGAVVLQFVPPSWGTFWSAVGVSCRILLERGRLPGDFSAREARCVGELGPLPSGAPLDPAQRG